MFWFVKTIPYDKSHLTWSSFWPECLFSPIIIPIYMSLYFSTDSHRAFLLWCCNNSMNVSFHLVKLLISPFKDVNWEKEVDNLNSQSQNYQRIMPVVRGRENHPQHGKLRTNVLLFLLWVLQLTHRVREPWPLCHTGSCCALFSLFCWFWSFFGCSASVCTRVWKQHLLQ